ncbi:MAG: RNA degradosome polyphosphate kinase [Eubacterium sp.]|nr:RNA degradosome polyphosphate kinase [Eubacterium sp.]
MESSASPFTEGSSRFINRELSWLDFNTRILAEARDTSIPLMERVKFLSITASNLDEFYMVRFASLKDQVNAGYKGVDIAGMTAIEQIEAINEYSQRFVEQQYNTYNRSFLPQLKKEGLKIVPRFEDLNEEQADYVDRYFTTEVYPVLTPMAVDSSRPFPLIRNNSLNIGALLQDKKDKNTVDFATVQVPSGLPRVVTIPTDEDGCTTVILLEQIIEKNIGRLFTGYKVLCATPYRIMRNADLPFDEDEAADLLVEIENKLRRRQWGEPISLEVETGTDKQLLKVLKHELPIREELIFRINGPIDLTFLMKIYGLDGFDRLKDKPYTPQQPKYLKPDVDLFEQIREHDVLLHHPYESFDPVVRFISKAARDDSVLAIKQTLYRVSSHSPIIASLAEAAENGKQVSVLVELKARFDEENNIVWAKKLEEAGCHVIYGLVGLKTHSKITLVVRREEDGIRRYVHLATGNYNDSTAKLYTDMGLFTCKRSFGEDATAVFNMLSGYSEPMGWNKLTLAPQWLRDKFIDLIEREIKTASKGKPARIIAKMNSLCDKEIIETLYKASAAGVSIDLIVRGICCLRAGVTGLSENIRVRSIVGTFLEHSRIFYFENNGNPEVYMGSADWMPRNLDKRVEILFPVDDPVLRADVIEILNIQLNDTKKARIMQPDGSYEKIDLRGKKAIGAQETFCALATSSARQ